MAFNRLCNVLFNRPYGTRVLAAFLQAVNGLPKFNRLYEAKQYSRLWEAKSIQWLYEAESINRLYEVESIQSALRNETNTAASAKRNQYNRLYEAKTIQSSLRGEINAPVSTRRNQLGGSESWPTPMPRSITI